MRAYLHTDIVDAGCGEDGRLEAEVGQVVVEFDNGRRFAHNCVWHLDTTCQSQDDGWSVVCPDDTAKASADRLVARVTKAIEGGRWSPESNTYWTEIEPAYGSPAYARDWREYEADRAQLDKRG